MNYAVFPMIALLSAPRSALDWLIEQGLSCHQGVDDRGELGVAIRLPHDHDALLAGLRQRFGAVELLRDRSSS